MNSKHVLCGLVIFVLSAGGSLSLTYPGLAQAGLPTTTPTAIPTVTANKQWTPVEQTFDGVTMVLVPPGCFIMGSTDEQVDAAVQLYNAIYGFGKAVARHAWSTNEQPPHKVCIRQGFWMDTYEVTNAAFQAFVDAGGYTTRTYWSNKGWQWRQSRNRTGPQDDSGFTNPQQPRVGITWYEAEAYAKWRGGRLPTEAEWEYAARGPDSLIYPWGNTWDSSKLNAENRLGKTAPVGSYEGDTSWVGAYDLAGNACEWVADWYSEMYYQQQMKDDPTGPTSGQYRSLRGGAWDSRQFSSRAAFRDSLDPTDRGYPIGFRVLVSVGPLSSTPR